MVRILVVDDDPDFTRTLKQFLEGEGHDVMAASDGLEALALAKECDFDVAFVDVVIPKLDGLALMRRLVQHCPDVRIVAMSAHNDVLDIQGAVLGPILFLTKPFTLDEVGVALDMALPPDE